MVEEANSNTSQKVGQEQIHNLLFGDKLSWHSILYDLINTEQLDPWDLDISLLANKYLERVKMLEEANFFVSSKVLHAASLLLRIKSEILLNRDIQDLDDILFGKKEDKKYVQERITLDEEIPGLVPRTPLPRFKKVSLQELMAALGKAMNTETRRIKRVVLEKQHEIEAAIALPKKTIHLNDRIKKVHSRLKEIFESQDSKVAFSHIAEKDREGIISTFVPLLHLESQHKVWLSQDKHFDEIYILLKHLYEKHNKADLQKMAEEAEAEMKNDIIEEAYEDEIAKEEAAELMKREMKKKEKAMKRAAKEAAVSGMDEEVL